MTKPRTKTLFGCVEVDDDGVVRGLPVYTTKNGYRAFRYDGQLFFVHKMVAKCFVPNPAPSTFFEVHHKNGKRADNRAENLIGPRRI